EIEMNTTYYAELVHKLEHSGLPPSDYAFLSTHYALVAHQKTTRKYHLSLLLNGLALFVIVGLIVYVVTTKRKQASNAITATLSKQEQLVRQLILAGKSNKEIAAELFVSVHTVKSHITNLYSKLGVKNRKELLATPRNG
ncbi:MAG: LuxR C-terminal-related transcriptional regulator, partial [Bacteroidota bacterium]